MGAIQDDPRPTACRRQMAFADAVLGGEAQLSGVIARLVRPHALSSGSWPIRFDPITTVAVEDAIQRLAPDIIVDARLRKRATPERLRDRARLTVGLGPGFVAGGSVDFAVETSWENLGRILRKGPTLPLRGQPRRIRGHARGRHVYAAAPRVFSSDRDIGDAVKRGERLRKIRRPARHTPLAGRPRGPTRAGVAVRKGAT